MRKILALLVFSLLLVSACSEIEEFVNETNVTPIINDTNDSNISQVPADKCIDLEGGVDRYKYGELTVVKDGESSIIKDECLSSEFIYEYSCDGSSVVRQVLECPDGCDRGACGGGAPDTVLLFLGDDVSDSVSNGDSFGVKGFAWIVSDRSLGYEWVSNGFYEDGDALEMPGDYEFRFKAEGEEMVVELYENGVKKDSFKGSPGDALGEFVDFSFDVDEEVNRVRVVGGFYMSSDPYVFGVHDEDTYVYDANAEAPFVVVSKGAVKFVERFSEPIKGYMRLPFPGFEVDVYKLSGGRARVAKGFPYTLTEGETVEFEGETVEVVRISPDGVILRVGGSLKPLEFSDPDDVGDFNALVLRS